MDSKFYVSLEAARLLKEKGYRDKTMYGYDSKDQSMHTLDVREDYDWNDPDDDGFYSTETGEYVEMFAAPTKAEAIDWLDTKEIVIEISSVRNRKWRFSIYKNGWFQIDSWIHDRLDFSTRLEAEEAAIIKACELL